MTYDTDRSFLRAAALEYANEVVRKYGGTEQDALERGNTTATSCPVARTIRAGLPDALAISVRPADRSLFIVPDVYSAGVVLPLPSAIYDFAVAHDEGAYPDLRLAA